MRYADLLTADADRHLFSGKELDRINGLDIYDFHARQYDPLLGRFTSPDPMEEKYPHLSPYAYCAGNPIRFIDPTGKEIFITDSDSQIHFKNSVKEVFGEDFTNDFSFDNDGKLIFANSDARNALSETQLEIFAGIDKLIIDPNPTKIEFTNTIEYSNNNITYICDVISDFGGGIFNANDNTIYVASNYNGFSTIYLDQSNDRLGPYEINLTTTTALFHEIAERLVGVNSKRGSVVDYENIVCRVLNMELRPYDIYHSYDSFYK